MNNVSIVVEQNLCMGCGTCKSICQLNAIKMVRSLADYIISKINFDLCTDCGQCLKVCPGIGLPKSVIEKFKDIFRGNNISAYIGRATDNELWQNGQSGGVVSALLLFLIENKIIDSAIVNSFDIENKRPYVRKAYNKKEIIESQGSYYTQTPVNEISIEKAYCEEKYAAVVLGCQAQGIYSAKELFIKSKYPEYLIGLICSGTQSGLIIDDLINKSGIKNPKDINYFRFKNKRYYKWPGNVLLKSSNQEFIIDSKERLALKDIYGVYRCQCCFDQMNIFSDIVVGDPWKINAENLEKGLSIFIARTQKGKELIEQAKSEKYIYCNEIAIEEIYKGQTVDNRLKSQFFYSKMICEKENMSFPKYDIDFSSYKYNQIKKKKINKFKDDLIYKKLLFNSNSSKELTKLIKQKKRKNNIYKRINDFKLNLKKILFLLYKVFFKKNKK